jgi:DNA-binding response OmpR family regulator
MKRISALLIDDEEELVSSLAERLGFRGFSAKYATTGVGGVALAQAEAFDVVVLDVKMPGLSGIELMRRLEEVRPGMRYVFLTGHGSEADFQACCEAGAASYLVKPVDIVELVGKLKEVIA